MASVGIVKISNGETIGKWRVLFKIQERFPLLRNNTYQLPYFLQANSDIAEAIKNCGCKNLDTISRKMVYLYIHDILIPQMLEEMYPKCWYQLEE